MESVICTGCGGTGEVWVSVGTRPGDDRTELKQCWSCGGMGHVTPSMRLGTGLRVKRYKESIKAAVQAVESFNKRERERGRG